MEIIILKTYGKYYLWNTMEIIKPMANIIYKILYELLFKPMRIITQKTYDKYFWKPNVCVYIYIYIYFHKAHVKYKPMTILFILLSIKNRDKRASPNERTTRTRPTWNAQPTWQNQAINISKRGPRVQLS